MNSYKPQAISNKWDALRMLKRMLVSILFLMANGLSLIAASQEIGTDARVLQGFLSDLQTYSSGFEQRLYSEFGEELEHSVGTVYIQRPGKFHWSYFEPYDQSIISDGMSLWIYDADLEQITVKDATHSLGDSPAAILDGSGDIDAHYIVLNTGNQDGVEWLELTPRDADSDYTTVRLGFSGAVLSGMILLDNLGQRTEITFKDSRRNIDISPSLFEFTPPPGIDIIDSRTGPGTGPDSGGAATTSDR